MTSVSLQFTILMIQSFRHKGLRLLWEKGDNSKLPSDQTSRIERMLDVIDSTQSVPEDFGAFQNWGIHKLSGDLKDFWSLKVIKITGSYLNLTVSMLMNLTISIIIN